ncbi:hypothetical protein GCM10009836_29720 [Pseudonocardia ailaonensis]|uniref:Protein-L-isoaspartate O-methyltransferase n=1 Tax=Pseudonocardia ailaonensis TaxID=367279 RepID=A0ABN2N180_9PSEU
MDAAQAHAGLTARLREGGAAPPAVLAAFAVVPRHLFLPGTPVEEAYEDRAIPTQTTDGVPTSSSSQPSMMAIMLGQLDVRPGHRVLEIGAGTGYNAALLARLTGPGGSVTSIDIDPDLVARAAEHLAAAGVEGVDLRIGDGALGVPDAAPYDRIVLTVGSWDIRPEWVAQLAPGGRLLLPLTLQGSQLSVAFDLADDRVLRSDSVYGCGFMRLRGSAAGPAPNELLRERWTAQPGDGPRPDLGAVSALLDQPGQLVELGGRLTHGHVWHGVGLWLMIHTPGTLRILTTDPAGAEFVPIGDGHATIALTGPDGLAALTADPLGTRAYGPGGDAAAARLRDCVRAWRAAGMPVARDLRLVAVPAGADLPCTGTVVEKTHCRLLVLP